jgi:hypothetical protein
LDALRHGQPVDDALAVDLDGAEHYQPFGAFTVRRLCPPWFTLVSFGFFAVRRVVDRLDGMNRCQMRAMAAS